MNTDPLTDIEKLHLELFGTVPDKHGTAYERVAAVVIAVLGWDDIEFDQTERPEGLLGSHQLDVRCRRADGTRARLIIECKDIGKEKKVDQDVLLKLVAVQDRLGAEHSAVITTSAFTRGARQVAVDHDVALIRLRPYEPTKDDGTWIRAVDVELRMGFAIQSDIELLTDAGVVTAKEARAPAEAWMDVRDVNGIASATVGDLFAQGEVVSQAEGITKKEVILKEPMELESATGWVLINGLRWTEKTEWTTQNIRREATGEPRLILQQLDADGESFDGQVIVTTKLDTWEIDERHRRVRRRRLA